MEFRPAARASQRALGGASLPGRWRKCEEGHGNHPDQPSTWCSALWGACPAKDQGNFK